MTVFLRSRVVCRSGMLKSGKLAFSPPLRSDLQEAISKLGQLPIALLVSDFVLKSEGMGLENKIVFRFSLHEVRSMLGSLPMLIRVDFGSDFISVV